MEDQRLLALKKEEFVNDIKAAAPEDDVDVEVVDEVSLLLVVPILSLMLFQAFSILDKLSVAPGVDRNAKYVTNIENSKFSNSS